MDKFDRERAESQVAERHEKLEAEAERLRTALSDARQALANITVAKTVEEAQTIARVGLGVSAVN